MVLIIEPFITDVNSFVEKCFKKQVLLHKQQHRQQSTVNEKAAEKSGGLLVHRLSFIVSDARCSRICL